MEASLIPVASVPAASGQPALAMAGSTAPAGMAGDKPAEFATLLEGLLGAGDAARGAAPEDAQAPAMDGMAGGAAEDPAASLGDGRAEGAAPAADTPPVTPAPSLTVPDLLARIMPPRAVPAAPEPAPVEAAPVEAAPVEAAPVEAAPGASVQVAAAPVAAVQVAPPPGEPAPAAAVQVASPPVERAPRAAVQVAAAPVASVQLEPARIEAAPMEAAMDQGMMRTPGATTPATAPPPESGPDRIAGHVPDTAMTATPANAGKRPAAAMSPQRTGSVLAAMSAEGHDHPPATAQMRAAGPAATDDAMANAASGVPDRPSAPVATAPVGPPPPGAAAVIASAPAPAPAPARPGRIATEAAPPVPTASEAAQQAEAPRILPAAAPLPAAIAPAESAEPAPFGIPAESPPGAAPPDPRQPPMGEAVASAPDTPPSATAVGASASLPGIPAPEPSAAPARPIAPIPWPARQVVPFAVSLALGSDDSISLTLNPAELGRVEVAIARGTEAHVSLRAERPETLALLQRDRAELERALAGTGFGAEGRAPSVSFGLGFGGGEDRRDRRAGARDSPAARPAMPDAAAAPAIRHAAPTARGLIDLAF